MATLVAACEEADEGSAESTLDDLRGEWELPRFDLSRDAWVVQAGDGSIAGHASVWPREDYAPIEGGGYVDPGHRRRGIGKWLVRAMEGRARELAEEASPGTEVLLRCDVVAGNRDACDLFESEGFRQGRHFWRMQIDLGDPPPEPAWPHGVTVRTFMAGDETEIHALVYRAFSDNYRHVGSTLEDWRTRMMDRESFDAALWFLAVNEGTIIGAALCPDYPDQGWVRQLAVAREWRGRGIGTALLREAFREFRRRGKPHAGLVMDSYNRSGAHQFYVGVGMRVEREYQEYEKAVSG
ncbi:MAG TPA: GNAT family N-acetyltransferase [Dehalococcoidia bacterium]|nr:GNAT family N-acetyltransferase [Dehalococcoidia bacterium]